MTARSLGALLEAPVALAGIEVGGLGADSRKVAPGDAFFALAGAKDDGLRHVADAVVRGARAIVAERRPEGELGDAAFVQVPDARLALARAASRFYPDRPETIVAVTGTSGKTSVAAFARQIWLALGAEAASLGTIGVVSRPLTVYGSLTTPDPVALHRTLARLAEAGVTHLAMEASSHGLDQKRLDGVTPAAAAFTNLSRDHMDYHATEEEYLAAKLRLFRELLPPGAPAVIDADSAAAPRVIAAVREADAGHSPSGSKGEAIRLVEARREGFSTRLSLAHAGRTYEVMLPLPGDFQVSNALVAAGLCLATGSSAEAVFVALGGSKARRGGSRKSATRTALPYSSTTRTNPTRWRRRWPRCARSSPAGSSSCSAAAATATRASGRSWARSPRAGPTS